MAKYVISDLHGEYDMFISMLDRIQFSDKDELYILGDVLDRGSNSLAIIDYIVKKDNITWIKGNHDNMLVEYIEQGELFLWFMNGGQVTYEQIMNERGYEYMQSLSEYIKRLPVYKVVDNYILVHAGAISPSDKHESIETHIDSLSEDFLLWDRSHIGSKFNSKYTLICGHTVTFTFTNSNKIVFDEANNKIFIDCGATFKEGQLGCLRLDDLKEFYIKNNK